MSQRKLLGSSTIKKSFSATVIQEVRQILKIKSGDLIVFALSKNNEIYIQTGILQTDVREILGSYNLNSNNSVTVPEKVRKKLKIKAGDKLGFYTDDSGQVTVQG